MSKFQPGQSGNPSGRPKKIAAVQALARQHTVAAIRTLVEVMNGMHGAKATDRERAANAILNRGWGAPTQPVDLNGKVGVTVRIVEFRESPEGEVESSEDGADGE
jgi:hypothetical protein